MILLAKEVMKMKLRKAKHSDLAAIMAIINQAKAYFKSHGINQWQDGYPNEISIVNDIQRNESYVLDNDGDIVATVMISANGENNYNYIEGNWLTDDKYLVIHRIAIRDDQKGNGLAKIIFDQAIELFDLPSLRIDTHEDNKSMQRFLQKYGFSYCGIIYLENKETRLAFEKIIS